MGRLFRLKGCPRCGGDLFSEEDTWSLYIVCWQCGHVEHEEEKAGLRDVAGEESGEPLFPVRKRRRRTPRKAAQKEGEQHDSEPHDTYTVAGNCR